MTASAHPLTSACASARIEWQRWVAKGNGSVSFSLSEPVDGIGMLAGWRVLASVWPAKTRNESGAFRRLTRWCRTGAPMGFILCPSDRKYLARVQLLWGANLTVSPVLLLGRAGRRPEFVSAEEAKAAVDDLLTGADVTRLVVAGHDWLWSPVSELPGMFPDPVELARHTPRTKVLVSSQYVDVWVPFWHPCAVCRESLYHPSHHHNPAGHPYQPGGDQ